MKKISKKNECQASVVFECGRDYDGCKHRKREKESHCHWIEVSNYYVGGSLFDQMPTICTCPEARKDALEEELKHV